MISWFFFFSSRRRHTILQGDWSSDVCSSDLPHAVVQSVGVALVVEALYDNKGHAYGLDDGVRRDSSIENLAKLKPFFEIGRATGRERVEVTEAARPRDGNIRSCTSSCT